MIRIIHITNPVAVSKASDLYIAQPITFESFRVARNYNPAIDIVQCTAQYKEDEEIIPDFLVKTRHLKKSMINYGGNEIRRKLPLIRDILKRAYRLSRKGDYIIYTNVDIALKPEFYAWVYERINSGLDAFIINRRTISSEYTSPDQLPRMFEETGEKHPGYDCFVFRRELYKKMVLEKVCIGAARIGLAMYVNMKLLADNFFEFGEEHLTFHIGNDQVWKNRENDPYAKFNEREFNKIKEKLAKSHHNFDEVLKSAFPSLKN